MMVKGERERYILERIGELSEKKKRKGYSITAQIEVYRNYANFNPNMVPHAPG